MAGAGVEGGTTYGKSDDQANRPIEHPVTPEDLAATLYWAMGINPELMLPDQLNRPIPIVTDGKPVKAIFG